MIVRSRLVPLLLAALLGLTVAACGGDDGGDDGRDAVGTSRADAAAAVTAAYGSFQAELRRAIATSAKKGATVKDKKASAAGARAAFARLGEQLRAIDFPDAVREQARTTITAIDAVAEAFEAQAEAPRSEFQVHAEASARSYGDADQAIQALREALGLTESDRALPE